MAAAIKAGFYTVGLAGGVETMTSDGMSWKGSVNPKIESCAEASDCLLPMGTALSLEHLEHVPFGSSSSCDQGACCYIVLTLSWILP